MSQSNILSIIILFVLIITANFPVDIHVPALPTIVRELNVSISHSQLTVSLFLGGYGFFALFYGSLSDAYGRRRIILIALSVLLVGSLICCLAQTISTLLLGRFVQGAGSAGCMSIPRSILRDSFAKTAMARVSSLLGVAVELTLACSPLIGGYLVHSFGWHSNFLFVLVLTLLTTVIVWFLFAETNQQRDKEAVQIKIALSQSQAILKHPAFIRYVAVTATAFGCGLAFFTISPFVIQDILHYSAKDYGLISLLVTGAISLGSFANACAVKRFDIDFLIVLGLTIIILSGITLLVVSLLFPASLLSFILPCFGVGFSLAFLFGNCMAGALHPFPRQAGLASSLYSSVQIFTSFLLTTLISLLPHNNGVLLALIFIITAMSALINFHYVRCSPAQSV